MSFAAEFEPRWERVIQPAIRRLAINGNSLEPHRVDARKVSASLLTEILDGVGTCRLFLADISTFARANGHPFRNGNVMYEVGLAHALRLPEEVLLFRSDDDPLLFDVANVRVNRYDPDANAAEAADTIVAAMRDAFKELDQTRNMAVRRAAMSLDYPSWVALSQAAGAGSIGHPPTATMGQVLGASTRAPAIARLLEMGALATAYARVTPEMIEGDEKGGAENLLSYRATPFGVALLAHGAKEMGLFEPQMRAVLEKLNQGQSTPGSAGAA